MYGQSVYTIVPGVSFDKLQHFFFQAVPQTPTVPDLIRSVEMEDLSTFVGAMPMKTARLARFVTQETWTEMATTRSVFRMVVISWTITALATMLFVTSLTMKTASTVTI